MKEKLLLSRRASVSPISILLGLCTEIPGNIILSESIPIDFTTEVMFYRAVS